jgi:hypothetical protein
MNTLRARERTSGSYTATLRDENGAVVPGSVLTSLTLTFTDVRTGEVINGRTAQNVLNANGVTVNESGVMTWTMSAADNQIIGVGLASERHVARFTAQWGVAKQVVHEVAFEVENLEGVS